MTSTTNKIKIALCGLGQIGKRHYQIINDNKNFELIACIDVDKEKSSNLNIQVPHFLSLEDFLESGISANIIAITTPNYLHCSQAISALKSGINVLLEKPMGLSAGDCEKVISASEKQNLNVFCVMQNRYSPPSAWLKNIVDQNVLGEIFHVQVNCFWNRSAEYYAQSTWKGKLEEDGGTLFTQFSHFIDTLYWLFGDMKILSANFKNYNHQNLIEFEDSGVISFEFLKGGNGTFNYSTSAYNTNLESSITILAQKGTIKIGGQYMEKLLSCEIQNYSAPEFGQQAAANDYGTYKGSAANHAHVYENIAEVFLADGTIHATAQQGKNVVDIIERIYAFRSIDM